MRLLALAPLLVVACGGDGNHNVDAPIVLPDGPPDAPKPVDAAVDAPAMAHEGLIELTQGKSNGSNDSGADASYADIAFGPVTGTDGPCTVYSGMGTPATFDGGQLVITGGAQTITMNPSGTAPDVSYDTTAAVPKPAFTAGATITFTSDGGPDVPSWTTSVTAPATLAGYTPPTTMSRAGYTANWTAGSSPLVWVIFAGFGTTTAHIGICRVTDTGSFTIPSTTFALLDASETNGFVGVGRISASTVQAGSVSVTAQAVSFITSGQVTITP